MSTTSKWYPHAKLVENLSRHFFQNKNQLCKWSWAPHIKTNWSGNQVRILANSFWKQETNTSEFPKSNVTLQYTNQEKKHAYCTNHHHEPVSDNCKIVWYEGLRHTFLASCFLCFSLFLISSVNGARDSEGNILPRSISHSW